MCFRHLYSNLKFKCWHPDDDENVELMHQISINDHHHLSHGDPSLGGPSIGSIINQHGAYDGHRNRLKLTYNTQLPSEHTYLGKLERVEALERLEPGSIHRIPVSGHQSIVYPGETIPLILTNPLLEFDGKDSNRIGLVFWEFPFKKRIFGVICEVYEKVIRDSIMILKTKAQQRFELVPQEDGALTRSVQREGRAHYYAQVKILPEVLLPDPLTNYCMNNTPKINNLARNRLMAAQSSVWPKFVYDQYCSHEVLNKMKRFLEFLQIESVPTADPVMLSFWLAKNFPLSDTDRKELFYTNSVLTRMLLVNSFLDYTCSCCCKKCNRRIANYADMFAMSKHGVSGSYCNPSGFVHETLTVYRVVPQSTRTTTKPSTDFSWFPGYSWQIAVCNACSNHIGWKFVATKRGYKPKKFYGLCAETISVSSDSRSPPFGTNPKSNADMV
ncbi:AAEL005058-PA [Aedes aegypti]|uniref:Protein cereblon n=2 Tax=Aedes aegypti TaxID=7159 RepID=A0A1S4F9F6_AEDAE|nr:protein cereblon homolog [Aedes aegypti]EAT43511.1 AAEL005058-PA [Aedes aegypti]